ncbi:MAG TPA: hypothetical protein VHC46_00890, partial [Thermodesulfobacteriota bacterium]|nr:hypothetical protein [Thermodesulfobacteriota bacterium]
MWRSLKSGILWILILAVSLSLSLPLESKAFFGTGSGSSSSSKPSKSKPSGSKSAKTDPTSAPGDKLSTTLDTYIDQKSANKSYGATSTLQLNSRNKQIKQGLIKFDTSRIASSDKVTSAKLWVYVASKGRSTTS